MSAIFPGIDTACAASTAAMILQQAAKTRIERIQADNAAGHSDALAVAAYGEELLPALFGGKWRLSRRNAHFPYAILAHRRGQVVCHRAGQVLFDHPLVYRQQGTHGPDTPANIVIIGRPYPIAKDGELTTFARQDAAQLAALGWGIWWRPDLSTHFPGWTQLVLAKHGLQACAVTNGFRPVASPCLGTAAWDEWAVVPMETAQ